MDAVSERRNASKLLGSVLTVEVWFRGMFFLRLKGPNFDGHNFCGGGGRERRGGDRQRSEAGPSSDLVGRGDQGRPIPCKPMVI